MLSGNTELICQEKKAIISWENGWLHWLAGLITEDVTCLSFLVGREVLQEEDLAPPLEVGYQSLSNYSLYTMSSIKRLFSLRGASSGMFAEEGSSGPS